MSKKSKEDKKSPQDKKAETREKQAEQDAESEARHKAASGEYDPKKKYVVALGNSLSCGRRGLRGPGDPIELADLCEDAKEAAKNWAEHAKHGLIVELLPAKD